MSFIVFYAGHFLFRGELKKKVVKNNIKAAISGITYKHISKKINGQPQEMNILEMDVHLGKVEIKPVLSYDSVYGFESLTSMASRAKAYAATNAGFFHEYGQPSGTVIIDEKLITATKSINPVFILKKASAQLSTLKIDMTISCSSGSININGINREGKPGELIIYTSEYGSTNRVELASFSMEVNNGEVGKIENQSGNAVIPQKGMLLTYFKTSSKRVDLSPLERSLRSLKTKDAVKFLYRTNIKDILQAYECGSWILKNGKVVIKERVPWVGLMTNNDPRTAIGLKSNGNVVLITVDGRQPGFSIGMTGKEFAAFLLSQGIKDAALLDGGASTEMIIKGKIVNRISSDGIERPIGGGIIVKVLK